MQLGVKNPTRAFVLNTDHNRAPVSSIIEQLEQSGISCDDMRERAEKLRRIRKEVFTGYFPAQKKADVKMAISAVEYELKFRAESVIPALYIMTTSEPQGAELMRQNTLAIQKLRIALLTLRENAHTNSGAFKKLLETFQLLQNKRRKRREDHGRTVY